jgi:drug/metabolite transporter (DMT)-like permease
VIIFFQNLFGTLCLLSYWLFNQNTFTFSIRTIRYPFYHSLRIITAILGILLWYKALKYIPLTEALALNFTGPILTALGAWFLLKENINLQRFFSVVLSIAGAFIIARPDLAFNANSTFGWAVLLPIGSALVLAACKLMVRKLGSLGEKPPVLTAYLLIFMTPCSLVFALAEWQTPELHHWPWLILLGALASLAHLSFAKAYALAEVTFLTPFGFLRCFLSAVMGYVFFKEFPNNPAVWLGIFMIFASIFVLNYKMPLYLGTKRLRSTLTKDNRRIAE